MTSASSNPYYGAGSAGNTQSAAAGYQRLALDNLIRRELKVSDPNDPQQIANALLERFKTDPRAGAIQQEARGLPFLQTLPMAAPIVPSATASDAELQQARDDVERDLQELLTNSLLKDVTPEIQGWAQAVRSAITEGSLAARFALDPRQRDKAFAIRRQLGDYARLARLVGALTPAMNFTYRSFAQSLDEAASVMLVLMGEALANVGFAGGRFLLQAPYTELQVRRDAVIYALRNLIGSTQDAYGPNDWPRGLDAYRRLMLALEEQGQGDLRSLLGELELTRLMDELIQRCAHGTVTGLRALGATAQLDLQRFRRIIAVGRRVVPFESPPLTSFLESLQLFADAFDSSGGFRLLRIARPPILFYGLYGSDEMEPADRRLLQLLIRRGILAGQLDCLMRCDCDEDTVICQILLDKVLYDVDRAIDLYALGDQELGPPELRAAAYSYVIDAAQAIGCGTRPPIADSLTLLRANLRPMAATPADWPTTITPAVFEQLRSANTVLASDLGVRDLMRQELCIQRDAEQRWEETVATMVPACIELTRIFGNTGRIEELIDRAINGVATNTVANRAPSTSCDDPQPQIPPHFETSLAARAFIRGPRGEDGTQAFINNGG